MIKRILLIDIDLPRDEDGKSPVLWSHHPIGLMYLASAVQESFPDMDIRVFHTITNEHPIEYIQNLVEEFDPDLIGLRSLSIARKQFEIIARKIRELKPRGHLIAGGPYPSASYRNLLLSGLVDLVVIGEGERTFVELIERLRENKRVLLDLDGTAVLENGRVRVNAPRPLIENIDTIPFPDYKFVDLKDYTGISNHALQDSSKSAFICSSRGCPYNCFYCHQLFGKKNRRRSAKNLIAEMREHVEKRGINNFVFVDDIFNVPMKACKEILAQISKELPNVQISFPNGLRADQLDDEMVDMFEKAGTVEMALAIETASPRLQKIIGKNLNLERAKEAVQSVSKRFIARTFYMVGFPTETYEEAMETVNFSSSLDHVVEPMLSVLRVYEGTTLFEMLEPNEEQCRMLASQEQEMIFLKMQKDPYFYGDLFSKEKVPLSGDDIKKIMLEWIIRVLGNKTRIRNSHKILQMHLNHSQILEYFRNIHNKPEFNEKSLNFLLKT